jgi:hypothetical protein
MCNQCTGPSRVLIGELENIIQGESKNPKRMVNPKKVDCTGFPGNLLPAGVTDPIDQLEKLAQRAVEMLSNTIDELTRVRSAILAGKPIGWPLLSDAMGTSLAQRMNINVEDRGAWKGDGPGKVGLVIRWLTRIRDLLASGDLRYTCLAKELCPTGRWAWTFPPTPNNLAHLPKLDFFHIRLCRRFWTPTVSPDTHFEFQAQTLIHETSHIYYATLDVKTVGPWIAECISQFVTECNGGPLDPTFADFCIKKGKK